MEQLLTQNKTMSINTNLSDNIFALSSQEINRIYGMVKRSYLNELQNMKAVEPEPESLKNVRDSACFFPIEKIVYDKEENLVQKLTSVYACCAVAGINPVMIIHSSAVDGIKIYLGVCGEESYDNETRPKAMVLKSCFEGHFPGSRIGGELSLLNSADTEELISKYIPTTGSNMAVACISGIASIRDRKTSEEKNDAYLQGIEKLIETMGTSEYTLLILADSIMQSEINAMQGELESLYTSLIPFAKGSMSVNRSEGNSVTNSLSKSLSKTINESSSKTLSIGQSHSEGISEGSSESFGTGSFFSVGYGSSSGNSQNDGWNIGQTAGNSHSVGEGESQTSSTGETVNVTSGTSAQIQYENKTVQELLNSIDQQLQRLKSGASLGMFAVSTYVIAPFQSDTRIAASTYKAIVSGEKTYLENACINCWNRENSASLLKWLGYLKQPVFRVDAIGEGTKVTPAVALTSQELAISMGLPKKSVRGIPVTESVPFGRNVVKLSGNDITKETLNLGNIYHHGTSFNTKADIDLNSLTMHTFVTGTTGSGKSNTVYCLLNKIKKQKSDVPFLVIEPAKGEYKDAFANLNDIQVYGVNPYLTPLLRINPFRFHKEIHILEHIDRILSIFNVCWPMEAAMPAILKQAIERSYELAGWNLKKSTNQYSDQLFPTFEDVMYEVKKILDESEYSAEAKGDYVGALCTRLKELTTGLNGMIFSSNDLADEDLFERNVIIDLSGIGSSETKALIMGFVVVRLQEYRQVSRKSIGGYLKHITVLEEAHHLLRKAPEGIDNLVSKSVEILTNAIAEMRSAGEGFIVADQSPGLLDKSVIRNTNTKIVLRLPDFEDRELVGKAMGLNDAQIVELSKLPTGVAALYQNDWMESVLVQIPYFEIGVNEYCYSDKNKELFDQQEIDEYNLLNAIMEPNNMDNYIDSIGVDKVDAIAHLDVSTKVKLQLIKYYKNQEESKLYRIARIAFEFFEFDDIIKKSDMTGTVEEWCDSVLELLDPSVTEFNEYDKETLLLLVSSEYSRRKKEFTPWYLELVEKFTGEL